MNEQFQAFVTVCQVQLDSLGFDEIFFYLKSYISGYLLLLFFLSAHQPESLPNERAFCLSLFSVNPGAMEAQPKATEIECIPKMGWTISKTVPRLSDQWIQPIFLMIFFFSEPNGGKQSTLLEQLSRIPGSRTPQLFCS